MPCFIKLTDQTGQKVRVNMDLIDRYQEALRPNAAPGQRSDSIPVGTNLLFQGADGDVFWVKERPSEIDNLIIEWEERG